jgi:hypothetical protein
MNMIARQSFYVQVMLRRRHDLYDPWPDAAKKAFFIDTLGGVLTDMGFHHRVRYSTVQCETP